MGDASGRHAERITPAQIGTLEALRDWWGVSLSALIRRAFLHRYIKSRSTGIGTESSMPRKGLRDQQDFNFVVQPNALRLFLAAVREHGYSNDDLCRFTCSDVHDLQDAFGPTWPYPTISPSLSGGQLRLVPSH